MRESKKKKEEVPRFPHKKPCLFARPKQTKRKDNKKERQTKRTSFEEAISDFFLCVFFFLLSLIILC